MMFDFSVSVYAERSVTNRYLFYLYFKHIDSSVLFDDPFHVTSGKDKGM